MNGKKWSLSVLAASAAVCGLLGFCGWLTYRIDPYFHYHKPEEGVAYLLNEERYQNNGILRNFDYGLVISGSSMASNFKPSEAEALFGLPAVKTAFRGGTLKEINDNMQTALSANPDLRIVIRPADGTQLGSRKDQMNYSLPEYLLDEDPINDIYYLLNKDTFFEATLPVLNRSRAGEKPTDFDSYGSWMPGAAFGRQAVLAQYQRPEPAGEQIPLSPEREAQARENIEANLLSTPRAWPDRDFYYFFPPYSLCYFDRHLRDGSFGAEMDLYRLATRMLLKQDNIHLFAFFDDHEMVENFDNFTDVHHYHEDINSEILRAMAEGSHRLTRENADQYWDRVEAYYGAYPYEDIFGD